MKRLLPREDGKCECGCGGQVKGLSFFLRGHDIKAVREIIEQHYGGVVQFVRCHRKKSRLTKES